MNDGGGGSDDDGNSEHHKDSDDCSDSDLNDYANGSVGGRDRNCDGADDYAHHRKDDGRCGSSVSNG